jgi:CDGSH-type Zn-finger protein
MCRCGKSAEPNDEYCGGCGQKFGLPAVPVKELSEEEVAALEAKARMRPSDVETPAQEIQ